MCSSVIVYQKQGHACAFFILWFQWKEWDWSTRLTIVAWFQAHFSVRSPFIEHKRMKRILCYSTREVSLLQVCLYRKTFNKTHFDDVGVTFTGEYHGTAGTNARTRFISDLFPHMKGNWSEICSCLHSRGSYPICATWEELGHFDCYQVAMCLQPTDVSISEPS